jgi:hypothetical protein
MIAPAFGLVLWNSMRSKDAFEKSRQRRAAGRTRHWNFQQVVFCETIFAAFDLHMVAQMTIWDE